MTPKKIYKRFEIGSTITASKIVLFLYDKERNRKMIVKSKTPFLARVTGIKVFKLGKVYLSSCGERSFTPTDTIALLEVRRGVMSKPLYVQGEDAQIANEEYVIPLLVNQFWSELAKEEMSKMSKEFTRDAKGRWK